MLVMDLFFNILFKLIPFYVVIFLGYFSAKKLSVQRESIAPILIYLVNPVVFFYGFLTSDIKFDYFLLPIVSYVVNATLCITGYHIAKRFYPKDDERINLAALASGCGNVGYFGLPVSLMLFGDPNLGNILFVLLGYVFFENTIAFFMAAKGKHSARDGFMQTLRLPSIYAAILALILKQYYSEAWLDIPLVGSLFEMGAKFKGSYTVLGMLMVGLGLAKIQIKDFKLDDSFKKFISLALGSRFIMSPFLTLCVIAVDFYYLHFLDLEIYKILLVLSVVPIGANSVSFATRFGLSTEILALAILISNFTALMIIPLLSVATQP